MKKVFVDGNEGTTGLRIHEYLSKRNDLELLTVDSKKRKDIKEREKLINESDIVFLCLPDEAAKESVSLIKNDFTRVIDASTAHRVDSGWVYGLPEISLGQREKISKARYVANPGCNPTGFILSLFPLVKDNIIPRDYPVSCQCIVGYSAGGKKAIERYENTEDKNGLLKSPQFYGLSLHHKHLPEMQKMADLSCKPLFTPVISNYYKGLAISIPLFPRLFIKKYSARDIHKYLSEYYCDEKFVEVMPFESEKYLDDGRFNIQGCNGSNKVEIFVFGNDDQILILSRYDNLGKGASGAAIQNMNIMLGLDEGLGLC